MEVLDESADGVVTVGSNFALFEYRYSQRVWAGRAIYRIRRTADGLRLVAKTVHLVNAGGPIETLAFLI
jgi:3-phenylpropionate/cinnamic acid dioxygenase small subunit